MSSVHVQSFTFNAFQENTYVVSDGGGNVMVFDPGCYERHEEEVLKRYLHEKKGSSKMLLNTHGHIDHVLGNAFVSSLLETGLGLHALDIPTLDRVHQSAHLYGFEGYIPSPEPAFYVTPDERLQVGAMEALVLFTPGHSPGHVVYYFEKEGFVINGDVLFRGSFGRTDLPGGSLDDLKKSIHNVLFQLPDDTVVYCGHGPSTTIGQERFTNYILQF